MEFLMELSLKELLILLSLMFLGLTVLYLVIVFIIRLYFHLLKGDNIVYKYFDKSYDIYEFKMRNRLISDYGGREDVYDYLDADSFLLLMDLIDDCASVEVKSTGEFIYNLMKIDCDLGGRYLVKDVEYCFHKLLWLKFSEYLRLREIKG